MKTKIMFAIALMASVVFTSCGSIANTSSATSASYTAGQTSGTALKNLYTQYKSAGKLDMTNLTTITNVLSLANSCQTLKSATKGSGSYVDFSKGLVLGSSNLVTTANSESVMSALTSTISGLNTSSLSSALSTGTTAVSNASSIASSVSSVLSLLGK